MDLTRKSLGNLLNRCFPFSFDGCIVLLSVLELFQEGKGGLSVLRTFRLLRILKLVRFMPALRYQLVVMLKTMDNVTVFFGLLLLFIFIFSYVDFPFFTYKSLLNLEHSLNDLLFCTKIVHKSML